MSLRHGPYAGVTTPSLVLLFLAASIALVSSCKRPPLGESELAALGSSYWVLPTQPTPRGAAADRPGPPARVGRRRQRRLPAGPVRRRYPGRTDSGAPHRALG